MIQNLTAVLGDHHQILHINTEFTGDGDAGFNGEYVAGLGQIMIGRRNIAVVMDFQTNEVTGTALEIFTIRFYGVSP